MAGPQCRAGSPWCTKPAARPGLAKVSPQPRGWPASLTTVRHQNPKAALDRIGVLGGGYWPGRRLLARCAAPGVPLPGQAGRPRPEERRDSPGPGCLSRRTRPSAPRGFARTTHPPPYFQPKASGTCSPFQALETRSAGQRGPRCPACTARVPREGAERGLRGRRSSLSLRGPRAPSPAPEGLHGKPSRMVGATHRRRGTGGSRNTKSDHLRSSQSGVCQKEAGRLWSRAEARGVTARGGAVRSARGRGRTAARDYPCGPQASASVSAQARHITGPRGCQMR